MRYQSTKSRKCFDGDNKVNWRHDMSLNIIYAYIKKNVMFDRSHVTLSLSLWAIDFDYIEKMKFKHTLQTSNEFKSFKNNMFEVLSNRMLFNRRIKDFIWCENDSFLFIIKLLIKILYKYDKKHNYDACDFIKWRLIKWSIAHIQINDRKIWFLVWFISKR